jgi:O-antigen ligase
MLDRSRDAIARCEGWVWSGLVLTASLLFVPHFPDGTLGKWQVLYVLASLSAVRLLFSCFDWFDLTVIAFSVYAISTYWWAVDGFGVIHHAPRWIAVTMIILAARRIQHWAPIHWAIGLSVLLICAMSDLPQYASVIGQGDIASGFMNENYATSYMVTALPMLFALLVMWPIFFLPLIVASVIYIAFLNNAKFEVAAIAAWAAVWFSPRFTRPGLWVPVGLVAILVILYAVTVQPASIDYRLYMWGVGIKMWLAAPWFGHGLGGFDSLFVLYAGGYNPLTAAHGAFAVGAAHNDWLQLFTDLGLAGAVFVGVLALMVIRTPNKPSWAIYGLAGLFAIAFLDFPLQQPGPLLLASLCLGASMAVRHEERSFSPTVLIVSAMPAIAIACILTVAGVRNVSAELHFRDMVDTYREHPLASYVHVREALRDWPFSKWYRREAYLRATSAGVVGVHLEASRDAVRSAYPWHPTVSHIEKLTAMHRTRAGGLYD